MAAIQVLALGYALELVTDMRRTVWLFLGVLFIVLGNYLPRVRSNWWMGIRTPWTLDSERVWRETHRVGGRSFVAGGTLAVIAALFPPGIARWVALSGLAGAALVPTVYSYFAWRREHHESAV